MEKTAVVQKVVDYIEECLFANISVKDIAKYFHYTSFYLDKEFKMVTGYSIGKYIRYRRLSEAAALLYTGMKIIDVTYAIGYESVDSFSKAFKRFHGFLPSKLKGNETNVRTFKKYNVRKNNDWNEVAVVKKFPMSFIGYAYTKESPFDICEITSIWNKFYTVHLEYIIKNNDVRNEKEKAILSYGIGEYGIFLKDGNEYKYIIAGKYTGGVVSADLEIVYFDFDEYFICNEYNCDYESISTKVLIDHYNIHSKEYKASEKLLRIDIMGNIGLDMYKNIFPHEIYISAKRKNGIGKKIGIGILIIVFCILFSLIFKYQMSKDNKKNTIMQNAGVHVTNMELSVKYDEVDTIKFIEGTNIKYIDNKNIIKDIIDEIEREKVLSTSLLDQGEEIITLEFYRDNDKLLIVRFNKNESVVINDKQQYYLLDKKDNVSLLDKIVVFLSDTNE